MNTFDAYDSIFHVCPLCGVKTRGLVKGFFVHCEVCVTRQMRKVLPHQCPECRKKTYGSIIEEQTETFLLKKHNPLCPMCAAGKFKLVAVTDPATHQKYALYNRVNQLLFMRILPDE